jgi:UDPglucose--hexose-1-phosphate uridylyltransferase
LAERRYDPLTDRWVIVSPQRVLRPWQGEVAPQDEAIEPRWSADCHLCPGNERTSGLLNPDYTGIYTFDNDHPALDEQPLTVPDRPFLRQEGVTGTCRVLCYHHEHNRTLGSLSGSEMFAVIDAWSEEQANLGVHHDWVQVFENRGGMMGASSSHPHGQIWASDHVPSLPADEDRAQARHQATHGERLLLAYAETERRAQERVVVENGQWLAVVPWWAAWPFETLLLPMMPLANLDRLNQAQRQSLADILQQLLGAYDRLFGVAMPYSMGWHGRGRNQGDYWQLHAHFYPPLLRSATIRKFMVGYEMLAEAQRDLTPEQAASRLRDAAVSMT